MRALLILILSGTILLGCSKQNQYNTNSLSDALYGFGHIQDGARTKVW